MDPEKKPAKAAEVRHELPEDVAISPRNHKPGDEAKAAKADDASEESPSLPVPEQNSDNTPPPEEEDSFFRDEDATEPEMSVEKADVPAPAAAATQPGAFQRHDTGKEVAWTASEFIYHEKDLTWYAILAGIGLVLVLGTYFLSSHDVFTTIVVAAIVVLFAFGAARKPRQMQYAVDDHGVAIGNRHFGYGLFRSYTIDVEDHFHSINLMPMKRFMPIISIYYDLDDEKQIAEVLTAHLPFDTHKIDPVEKLMRRIRF